MCPSKTPPCVRSKRPRVYWQQVHMCFNTSREQHVPDSSNHSLYLIRLFNFSSLEGRCGGNQQSDGSISLSLSPLSLPPTHNMQHATRRDSDTETETLTQRNRNPSVTNDLQVRYFLGCSVKRVFDLPQWFHFCKHLVKNVCSTFHVVERRTHAKFESFKKYNFRDDENRIRIC